MVSDQIDFLETKYGRDQGNKSYWAQNYHVYGRPRSILRKNQRKVASEVIVGESLKEVLRKSNKAAVDYNSIRASTNKLLLKLTVDVVETKIE